MSYTEDEGPSGLSSLTSLATDDLLIVGDTSDTDELVKAITFANLVTALASYFATFSGGTFTGDINVPDEAYGVSWNGSTEVPTKNALYDKIETITVGSGISEALAIAYATVL